MYIYCICSAYTVYIHLYTIYVPIYNAIMYETFIVFGMVHSSRIAVVLLHNALVLDLALSIILSLVLLQKHFST